MAWWGVGLSLGLNINEQPTPEKTVKAADALARAKLLAAQRATESERDYIAALCTRYTSAIQANEHATHDALDYRLSNNPKAERACGHCADFLSYAYMMQGNYARARQSAENY
jgi:hypothetical protein